MTPKSQVLIGVIIELMIFCLFKMVFIFFFAKINLRRIFEITWITFFFPFFSSCQSQSFTTCTARLELIDPTTGWCCKLKKDFHFLRPKVFFSGLSFLHHTLKFLDSKNASSLSKRLQHLQASVAFFLTFHDATTHMRRPFKYPPRIAHFG